MMMRNARALGVLFGGILVGAVAAVAACGSDEITIPPAAAGGDGATSSDGAPSTDSASGDAFVPDANVSDASGGADANGPGATSDMCTFNRDCMAALRCECTDPVGCSCQQGVRGTGKNGIDPCPGDNGSNLCASALCIEGPDGQGFFCSDECKTDADCTGMLPRCTDVAFVGRVCVRK